MWQSEICYTKQVLVAVSAPGALLSCCRCCNSEAAGAPSPALSPQGVGFQWFCSGWKELCLSWCWQEGAGISGSSSALVPDLVLLSSSNCLLESGLSQINPTEGQHHQHPCGPRCSGCASEGQNWLKCHLCNAWMSLQVNHCLRFAQGQGLL